MRRFGIKCLAFVVVWSVGGGWAVAQEKVVAKPLDGYVCMGLKTDKEISDWVPGSVAPKPGDPGFAGFPVFQSPTEESKQLGYQYSPAFVAWPEDEAGGFVRIIRINKEKAWIKKDALVAFGLVVGRDGHMVKLKRTCKPLISSWGVSPQMGGSFARE